jgi:hypothetical protein
MTSVGHFATHPQAGRGRYGGGFTSRDYSLPNPKCAVGYCPCNRYGRCELPAQIEIRADGRCQKAVDFKPNT